MCSKNPLSKAWLLTSALITLIFDALSVWKGIVAPAGVMKDLRFGCSSNGLNILLVADSVISLGFASTIASLS